MSVSAEIAQQDFEIWEKDIGTNEDEGGTEKQKEKRFFLKLFEEKVHQQKAPSQRQNQKILINANIVSASAVL